MCSAQPPAQHHDWRSFCHRYRKARQRLASARSRFAVVGAACQRYKHARRVLAPAILILELAVRKPLAQRSRSLLNLITHPSRGFEVLLRLLAYATFGRDSSSLEHNLHSALVVERAQEVIAQGKGSLTAAGIPLSLLSRRVQCQRFKRKTAGVVCKQKGRP